MPGFDNVGKVDGEHLVMEKPDQLGILHREGDFYPAVKIAGHHVGAAEVDLFLSGIAEIENAAVLKEAAHDTCYPDVIAHTG